MWTTDHWCRKQATTLLAEPQPVIFMSRVRRHVYKKFLFLQNFFPSKPREIDRGHWKVNGSRSESIIEDKNCFFWRDVIFAKHNFRYLFGQLRESQMRGMIKCSPVVEIALLSTLPCEKQCEQIGQKLPLWQKFKILWRFCIEYLATYGANF